MVDKTTERDGLDEVLDRGYPEAWRPESPGDQIKGVFIRLEEGPSQYGVTPIVVIGTPEGERSIWLFGQVIRNAFLKLKPVPGEKIAVRFLGLRKAKNPRPGTKGEYNDWRVAVDRPLGQEAPNWDEALAADPFALPADDQTEPDEDIPF